MTDEGDELEEPSMEAAHTTVDGASTPTSEPAATSESGNEKARSRPRSKAVDNYMYPHRDRMMAVRILDGLRFTYALADLVCSIMMSE
jgi:hypothetical protein